jgi:hypothetical protein
MAKGCGGDPVEIPETEKAVEVAETFLRRREVFFKTHADVAETRVHTPSNSAGTHFSAGQRLQL